MRPGPTRPVASALVPVVRHGARWRAGGVLVRAVRSPGAGGGPGCGVPAARVGGEGRVMAFRKISYLIPSCDGCGLAWSFFDPACADGIPPHFASRAAALEQLPRDYGWQVRPRRLGRPLMACRTLRGGRGDPGRARSGAGCWRVGLGAAGGAVRPGPPPAAAAPWAGAPGVADRRAAAGGRGAAGGDRGRELPGTVKENPSMSLAPPRSGSTATMTASTPATASAATARTCATPPSSRGPITTRRWSGRCSPGGGPPAR